MSTSAVDADQSRWTPREHSWLLPWNRKLRHVQRISIRNLTLISSKNRARGKVIDDDALPSSLKSPAKQLAVQEAGILNHSRSTDDLRPLHEAKDSVLEDGQDGANGAQSRPRGSRRMRPKAGRLRRRSTMDWSTDSPQNRQKRMEAVAAARLADVFVSIHVDGLDQPVYISELITQTMNADFQRIGMSDAGPGVTRRGSCVIKLWTRSGDAKRFVLFMDVKLDLASLRYLGKDLPSLHHPLPPNAMILHLSDGLYSAFDTSTPADAGVATTARARSTSPRSVRSASFDALLRLSKLDESIQDALQLQSQLAQDLERLTDKHRQELRDQSRVKQAKDFAKTVTFAKATVEKQTKALQQTRERKLAALQKRKQLVESGRLDQTTLTRDASSHETQMEDLRDDIATQAKAILSQRRRVSADLGRIYPIAPLPNKPLSFSIRKLFLPDSEELDAANVETVSAAMGYTLHVLQLATFYLNQSLPYPVHPRGSTSSITDPISNLKTTTVASIAPIANSYTGKSSNALPESLVDPSRTFPLYSKSSGPRYRFDYGLFLLNKNIEVLLSNAFGIRVLDIRQTLPNLAYILACMGAGEGDLPGRKVGGIRGLIRPTAAKDSRQTSLALGSNGLGEGIVMKREWQVTEEEEGLGKRNSFKSLGKKGNSGIATPRGNPTTAISSADWEGLLRGDGSSTRKAAGLINNARGGSTGLRDGGSIASASDTLVDER